ILDEELIAAGVANSGHRRWRKGYDKSFGNLGANARIYLGQDGRHSLFACGSLGEFLERKKHCGSVGLIAAEQIESRELNRVEHAGCFKRDLRDLVHDCLSAIERRRVW